MVNDVLIIIRSNPYESEQPGEAVRLGLGLVSSGFTVSILLVAQALDIMNEECDELLCEEELEMYLPMLMEMAAFYTDEKNAAVAEVKYIERPSELVGQSRFVWCF